MTHPRYRTRAWRAIRLAVLRRDGFECQLRCSTRCRGIANSVDHTVRPEDGGDFYDLANLRACCTPCNSSKRNSQLAERARDQPSRKW